MKKIIHLDMDAFFASIEERDNPKLKGKPVIVGAEPGTRGVVSTCNYIARKYGVHSAMSSAEAYCRCPSAVFVHPHFSKYKEASAEVHKIMSEYTDKIEFVSLDEGYMDVTGSEFLFGSAEGIAKEIKRRVFETLNVTCSVGVGYSMMSAKCASEEKNILSRRVSDAYVSAKRARALRNRLKNCRKAVSYGNQKHRAACKSTDRETEKFGSVRRRTYSARKRNR